VVTVLDIHGGVVAADGTGLLRKRDDDHHGGGGEEGTAHNRHHSPTKAIGIATVVVSTGPDRQLRNLWWNQCRLPIWRSFDGSSYGTTLRFNIDSCWRCWRSS
jgi:hypothetical protein